MSFPQIKFTIQFHRLIAALPKGGATAVIHSDARGADGFPYFQSVDLGRRELRPVRARALRWLPGPSTISPMSPEWFGGAVFSMRSRASRPQNLRERAIAEAMPAIQALAARSSAAYGGLVEFVNRAALLVLRSLLRITPRRTGKLRSSYRIDPAS